MLLFLDLANKFLSDNPDGGSVGATANDDATHYPFEARRIRRLDGPGNPQLQRAARGQKHVASEKDASSTQIHGLAAAAASDNSAFYDIK
jgi:hypothetical protein